MKKAIRIAWGLFVVGFLCLLVYGQYKSWTLPDTRDQLPLMKLELDHLTATLGRGEPYSGLDISKREQSVVSRSFPGIDWQLSLASVDKSAIAADYRAVSAEKLKELNQENLLTMYCNKKNPTRHLEITKGQQYPLTVRVYTTQNVERECRQSS